MPIPLGILAVAGAGAGAAGAYDLLETTLISTNTASVTFSSLGSYSAYKHLQIRYLGRTDQSGENESDLIIRFNSDTGTNYARHSLYGSGSSVFSEAGTSTASPMIGGLAGPLAPANAFNSGVIDILDFSSSSKNTTARCLSGGHTSSANRIRLASMFWNNTAAVTSITLFPEASSNLVSGSRFSLYGIK